MESVAHLTGRIVEDEVYVVLLGMRASTYGSRCSDSNLSLSACARVCFSSAMFALFSFNDYAALVAVSEMESDH